MQITEKAWLEYITKMSQISQKAADLMQSWVQKNGLENDKALLDYAYALSQHYGQAIGALSCVQLAGTKYDEAIEAAAGMIISSGYVPSGIAMDPTLSFSLSTMRDADGRKIYPEIGFGQNLTNFSGMTAAVSDTVSAKNEITPDTKLLGIVGQFDAFRWGVQRSIGAHLIEYGDPDGLGDLQRQNQIAIRAEIVYGIGIMDQAAFTKIVKAEE